MASKVRPVKFFKEGWACCKFGFILLVFAFGMLCFDLLLGLYIAAIIQAILLPVNFVPVWLAVNRYRLKKYREWRQNFY